MLGTLASAKHPPPSSTPQTQSAPLSSSSTASAVPGLFARSSSASSLSISISAAGVVSTTTSSYHHRPHSHSHTTPPSLYHASASSSFSSSTSSLLSSRTTSPGPVPSPSSLPQSFPPRRHSSSSLFNFGTDPKLDVHHPMKHNKNPRTGPYKNRHRGRLGAGSWQSLKELLERPREITSKPSASHRYDHELKIRCSIKSLLVKLEAKFRAFQLIVRPEGIRLTGGGASCVLSLGSESQLNDLDITIYLDDDRRGHNFADVLLCEEEVLSEIVEEQLGIRLSLFEIYQLFFRESFRISEKQEAWSIFRCGNEAFGIDIRVVERNRRNFVFSIDSFEIILAPLLKDATDTDSSSTSTPSFDPFLDPGSEHDAGWAEMATNGDARRKAAGAKKWASPAGMGPPPSPSSSPPPSSSYSAGRYHQEVEVDCNYGDFKEACLHLQTKQLKTWEPGTVRRGLLRYCLELAKGNRPSLEDKERLEAIFVEELYHEFAAWTNEGDEFQRSLHKFLRTHKGHAFQVLAHLHCTLRDIEPPPTVSSGLQMKMLSAVEETLAIYFM